MTFSTLFDPARLSLLTTIGKQVAPLRCGGSFAKAGFPDLEETRMPRPLFALLVAAASLPSAHAVAVQPAAESSPSTLQAALAAPTRTPANVARDKYRHPAETLAFFGVKPGDTVVELWPGGGWYTEVLAPYLANGGALTRGS